MMIVDYFQSVHRGRQRLGQQKRRITEIEEHVISTNVPMDKLDVIGGNIYFGEEWDTLIYLQECYKQDLNLQILEENYAYSQIQALGDETVTALLVDRYFLGLTIDTTANNEGYHPRTVSRKCSQALRDLSRRFPHISEIPASEIAHPIRYYIEQFDPDYLSDYYELKEQYETGEWRPSGKELPE